MAVALGMKGYRSTPATSTRPSPAPAPTTRRRSPPRRWRRSPSGVSPVSPLELANVGATLNSDGKWCPPTPVDTITDRNGKFVTWDKTRMRAGRAGRAGAHPGRCDGEATWPAAARPTRRRRPPAGRWTAAGKTGTTQEYKSSAYLGFTPEMSASVILWDSEPRPQSICQRPDPYVLDGRGDGRQRHGRWLGPGDHLVRHDEAAQGGSAGHLLPAGLLHLHQGSASTQVPNVVGKKSTTRRTSSPRPASRSVIRFRCRTPGPRSISWSIRTPSRRPSRGAPSRSPCRRADDALGPPGRVGRRTRDRPGAAARGSRATDRPAFAPRPDG